MNKSTESVNSGAQNLFLGFVSGPSAMISKVQKIDNKVDRLFSSTVAIIAGGTSLAMLGAWTLSKPIQSFCIEVKSSGLKALETIFPLGTNEYLQEICHEVNGYAIPLTQTCGSFKDKGLGAFKSLIPAKVEELMVSSCDFTLQHSGELDRICTGINESGLAVFDHIGSYNLKNFTLEFCSFFDSSRQIVLLGVGLTSVTLATYYIYRTCFPNRGNAEMEKSSIEFVPVKIEPDLVPVKQEN